MGMCMRARRAHILTLNECGGTVWHIFVFACYVYKAIYLDRTLFDRLDLRLYSLSAYNSNKRNKKTFRCYIKTIYHGVKLSVYVIDIVLTL